MVSEVGPSAAFTRWSWFVSRAAKVAFVTAVPALVLGKVANELKQVAPLQERTTVNWLAS